MTKATIKMVAGVALVALGFALVAAGQWMPAVAVFACVAVWSR